LQRPREGRSLRPMNLLATWKMMVIALGLIGCLQCHAKEIEEVDGPNVRKIRQQDGSKSIFIRSPDNKTLTKQTYSPNGTKTMQTTYKMDASGNPLSCKIKDGLGTEMFKVSYGYHKVTGLLVSELMFDSRVKRINKDTGKEQPVQVIRYLYDAEGKRSAPIVYNLLPGKTFEQVFGIKSSALESNPFKNGEQ
jgi:hypothetical protein